MGLYIIENNAFNCWMALQQYCIAIGECSRDMDKAWVQTYLIYKQQYKLNSWNIWISREFEILHIDNGRFSADQYDLRL